MFHGKLYKKLEGIYSFGKSIIEKNDGSLPCHRMSNGKNIPSYKIHQTCKL